MFIVFFNGDLKANTNNLIEDNHPHNNLSYNKDIPAILPDWNDGDYHDYPATEIKINTYDKLFPDLVEKSRIGTSILGRNISCIKITN